MAKEEGRVFSGVTNGATLITETWATDVESLPTSRKTLTFAEFEAHLLTRELFREGERVRLPDQSFEVLALLLKHPGALVTREDIRKCLWPGDTFVDFDHGLNNAVNRLREALGDSAERPRFIETLPRRGYRFIGTASGTLEPKHLLSVETSWAESRPEDVSPARATSSARHVAQSVLKQLTVAAAIIVVALVFSRWLEPPLPPASRSFVLPPDGTTFNLIGDSGGSVALSADGTELAFIAVDGNGTASIWVRPLSKLSATALVGTAGATFPFWSADGLWLGFFADGKLKKISLDEGKVVTLCDAPFGRGGSWSQSGLIIFAPDSHTAIYRVSDSGGMPTAVTSLDTSIHTTHRWPKFLPDGRHFIYLAASHFPEATHNGAYLGSVGGKENKLLVATDSDASYASGYLFFLRKGTLMAQPFNYQRGELHGNARPTVERVLNDRIIWKAVFAASESGVMAYQLGANVSGTQFRWFDRSGNQLGVLGEPNFEWSPRLSPNGTKLAAGVANNGFGYSNLWVYDVGRGMGMQLTFGKYDHGSPIWSRDGTRILFAGKRQHYSVYQVDFRGSESAEPLFDAGQDAWPLDLSPDGRFLLYGQGLNIGRVQSRLWICPINRPGSAFRLLKGNAVEVNAEFSPDGRWVAYASNESGKTEVYAVRFHPGSATGSKENDADEKIQLSDSGGNQPKWRRDGRELFYVAADYTLMSVPIVSKGTKLVPGKPHPLFRVNPLLATYDSVYDVSLDGTKFVINTAAQERTAPITLVENWLSDFKK